MKIVVGIIVLVGWISVPAMAQESNPEKRMDFWIGTWNVHWNEGENETGSGTNTISKTLDGCVVSEHFVVEKGKMAGYKGKSYSILNRRSGTWKQTWVDNMGGYLEFEGAVQGDSVIFRRTAKDSTGQNFTQRMVFHQITDSAMVWDWQISDRDKPGIWINQWRIFYKRKSGS